MKMRKIAKDTTGVVLKEGDIIQLHDGMAVIQEIDQPHREEFPVLQTSRVWLDWKGKPEKFHESRLHIDDYKQCLVVDGDSLRDDVPHFKNLRLISERIQERMAYRHNVAG